VQFAKRSLFMFICHKPKGLINKTVYSVTAYGLFVKTKVDRKCALF